MSNAIVTKFDRITIGVMGAARYSLRGFDEILSFIFRRFQKIYFYNFFASSENAEIIEA